MVIIGTGQQPGRDFGRVAGEKRPGTAPEAGDRAPAGVAADGPATGAAVDRPAVGVDADQPATTGTEAREWVEPDRAPGPSIDGAVVGTDDPQPETAAQREPRTARKPEAAPDAGRADRKAAAALTGKAARKAAKAEKDAAKKAAKRAAKVVPLTGKAARQAAKAEKDAAKAAKKSAKKAAKAAKEVTAKAPPPRGTTAARTRSSATAPVVRPAAPDRVATARGPVPEPALVPVMAPRPASELVPVMTPRPASALVPVMEPAPVPVAPAPVAPAPVAPAPMPYSRPAPDRLPAPYPMPAPYPLPAPDPLPEAPAPAWAAPVPAQAAPVPVQAAPVPAPEVPTPVREATAQVSGAHPADANTIGIVFVPSIGTRQPGEMLLSSSSPLLHLIGSWQATTRGVKPRNDPTAGASIDFSGASRPFVKAAVPAIGDHPEQTWLMTEAWWATRVGPPSVGAVLRWLVPRELFRLWKGIASGNSGGGSVLLTLVDLVFLPLFLLPAIAAVLLVYLLFRLLRLVPLRGVRESAAIAALELFLVDWFGDALVLVTDRPQAANMRARVAEAIEDCRNAGCGTIVLVGHSSGATIGYMTLADETYASLPVDMFITHGQTLGIAWRLGRADEYDTPDRNPARLYRGDRLRTNLSRLPFRDGLRWHDFWATHDGAPAGDLASGPWVTLPELVRGTTTRVFNRMSVRRDHDAYWDNDEEFVMPVARLIEGSPEGAPVTSRFFPESDRTRRVARRQRRVKILRFASVAVMASLVAAVPMAIVHPLLPGETGSIEQAGLATWDGLALAVEWLGLGFTVGPIASWFAILLGGLSMLFLYWLAGTSMSRLWTRWDARERQIALQPIPQWRWAWSLAFQLGLCGGAALWLLTFVASGEWSWTVPALGLLVVAWVLGLLTGRGKIRRPTQQELDLAGVRP